MGILKFASGRRCAVFVLLLLALSLHTANAAEVCDPGQMMGDSGGLIAIAFMLVTLLIAGAYMYGKGVEDEKAAVWAKDEAANLLITVLLFAGLAAFFSGSCNLAYDYTSQYLGATSPFQASYNYLDTLIQSNGINTLRAMVDTSIGLQKDATVYLNLGFTPVLGHGVATDANLRAQSSNIEFVIDLYLPLVASLNAQRQALQLIELASTAILLPFAFVLRIIPQTREFGNMLIALFFGLYIVLPTMYAMSGAAFLGFVQHPTFPAAGVTLDQQFGDIAFDGANSANWTPANITGSLIYQIGSTIPQAIFIPNIVLVVLVTCVMSLSKGLHAIQM